MDDIHRLPWRTSTRSSNGENCVEVAPADDGAIIRHSKEPEAGVIAFPSRDWVDFLRRACDGKLAPPNNTAEIIVTDDSTVVRCFQTNVELTFDEGEWAAFIGGALNGEFDFAPA